MRQKTGTTGSSNTTSTQGLLTRVPIFGELPGDALAELAALAQRRRFDKGEVVFHEGDVGAALYIVARGEVKIILRSSEGKEAILGFRKPGDFFGEMALLDDEPRSADVVATEPSEVLILRRDDFVPFIERHPRVALSLLAIMSRRLRSTTQLLHDASFLDIRSRLVRTLLSLVDARGELRNDGSVLIPRLFQNELANMVGATRESINKWLKHYERRGFLRLDRGRMLINAPHRLRMEIF